MNLCPHVTTETKCYGVTVEQSIKIYHNACYADLRNRRGYAYYIFYIYIYIYIYNSCGLFWNLRELKKSRE